MTSSTKQHLWENDARYPYPFYRVYDARTVYENNYIENDIDLGICVDVFPFDYYADVNKEMVKPDTYRRLSVYSVVFIVKCWIEEYWSDIYWSCSFRLTSS